MTHIHEALQRLNAGIFSACIIGIGISYYAYSIEITKEQDKSYEALCDISEHVSCSKAFMSEYGKGFGIIPKDSPLYLPNSIYGLVFYTIISSLSKVILLLYAVILVAGTFYIERILTFSLRASATACVSGIPFDHYPHDGWDCLFNRYSNTITLVGLAISSNVGSIYLAYILYLIKDVCILCIGTYIVNMVILVFSVKKLRLIFQKDARKSKLK